MGMPLSRTEWTADMLNDIPDDGCRYEVIDGELFVTPAPADVHQFVIGELHLILAPYAKRVGIDAPFSQEAACEWRQFPLHQTTCYQQRDQLQDSSRRCSPISRPTWG